jgi:hypothetical protein
MSATAPARRATTRRPPARAKGAHGTGLKVVTGKKGTKKSRLRTPELIAVVLVSLTLFAVVVGNTVLAQGQLRIGKISSQLTKEQAINRVRVLNVAALETPARIQQAASGLHLVQPAQILQLPSVSLDRELPELKITPAGGQ